MSSDERPLIDGPAEATMQGRIPAAKIPGAKVTSGGRSEAEQAADWQRALREERRSLLVRVEADPDDPKLRRRLADVEAQLDPDDPVNAAAAKRAGDAATAGGSEEEQRAKPPTGRTAAPGKTTTTKE